MSDITITRAEELASRTIEIVRSHFEASVRYAEAYGHEGRTVIADGSMFAPSTRVLPYASQVWDGTDDPEVWERYMETVEEAIDSMTVPEDTDSEAPEDWTLSWDEGVLFAYSPSWNHDAL